MKIKRFKILSPFRGLPKDYEIKFKDKITGSSSMINPICFVGLNGTGKSNVLEVIAEIFYYLETYHRADINELNQFQTDFGFEIEYQLSKSVIDRGRVLWDTLNENWNITWGDPIIKIEKKLKGLPEISAVFDGREIKLENSDGNRNISILPPNIVAYSSGMNELLSNPFIKIDFLYYDDLRSKKENSPESSLDMNRLFFLNYDSYKFMTLCNFLFDANDFDMSEYEEGTQAADFGGINLGVLKSELEIENIHSFKISLKLKKGINEKSYLVSELNTNLEDLKKCATFFDERSSQTKNEERLEIELFFWVNNATKEAFRHYFKTPNLLFRSFYFFQLLNIDLIRSATRKAVSFAQAGTFENLSDEIPKHESASLLFRIYDIEFKKSNGAKVNYRKLSDGEHQLLQILGSFLLLDASGSLFLLDEPETHFNPDWRSKLVKLINDSVGNDRGQEVILTTHSPYIVSDCKKENVFIFKRDEKGRVCIPTNPQINTFGSSISILSDEVFGKEDTISELSKKKISEIENMPLNSAEEIQAAKEASRELGESVEKVLLFKKLIMKEKNLGS